jgi:hypothetical protein
LAGADVVGPESLERWLMPDCFVKGEPLSQGRIEVSGLGHVLSRVVVL